MNILLIAATAALGALARVSPEGTDSLNYKLDSAVVAVSRAGERTPVTYTMVDGSELRRSTPSNSLPMLLSLQPSVVTSNEGGTGLGYSKMTVRGSKGTQINVTLNGITLNDSESQEVFWVNIPALSGLLSSVQLQRGLGTSASGPGAFGASVNMSTASVASAPFAKVDVSGGAFGTLTNLLSAGTGLLPGGFYASGAYSRGITDGYIKNAFADVQSALVTLGWIGEHDSLRFTWLMGDQRTGITWNGISLAQLQADRRYNEASAEREETDNYTQNHLQFNYTRSFGSGLLWSTTLNYTKGDGFYEQFKKGKKFKAYGFTAEDVADPSGKSDFLINKSMDNSYYVVKSDIRYADRHWNLTGSAYLSYFDGLHFGAVKWNPVLGDLTTGEGIHRGWGFGHGAGSGDGRNWYLNEGMKVDGDYSAKVEYSPSDKLTAYVDLQYRDILLLMSGTDDEFSDMGWQDDWQFFNPRAGITWTPSAGHKAYASVALGHREPGRSDIKEIVETNNAAGTSLEIKPEKMLDTELGYQFTGTRFSASAGLYLMEYKDMLLETGKLTDSGYAIKENVPRSWRRGVELAAAWKPFESLTLSGNAAFSVNQIRNYTAYYEDYDNIDDWHYMGQYSEFYEKTTMLMSPSVIASCRADWNPFGRFNAGADLKLVGKQYWDNTASEDRCLPAYAVANASISNTFDIRGSGTLTLGLYLGNLLNTMYEADAWVYRAHFQGGSAEWYQEEGLFPQAPFNCMLRMTLSL